MTNDTATPKTIAERFPGATPRPWGHVSWSDLWIDKGLTEGLVTANLDDAWLIRHAVNHYEALEASHARLKRALENLIPFAAQGQPEVRQARAAIEAAKEVTGR